MRVFGIDFTSAPSARKPISCAICRVRDGRLMVDGLCEFEAMESYQNFLHLDGPWVAGMDFPFGLPREFLDPARWSQDWSSYVAEAAIMDRGEFRAMARALANDAAPGQKYLKRRTDCLAGAQSPMNVTRPPVGLMFHAGAPALLASGASVLPVKRGDDRRVVVEAYPKLVAHTLIERRPYKDDPPGDAGAIRRRARAELVAALCGKALKLTYGMEIVGLEALADELVEDPAGDKVDALMCAVQAAWSWMHRDQGFGLPADADLLEGWIADPVTRGPQAVSLAN